MIFLQHAALACRRCVLHSTCSLQVLEPPENLGQLATQCAAAAQAEGERLNHYHNGRTVIHWAALKNTEASLLNMAYCMLTHFIHEAFPCVQWRLVSSAFV